MAFLSPKIDHHRDGPALHHEPVLVFVVIHISFAKFAVTQLGNGRTQADEALKPLQYQLVWSTRHFSPIEFGALESRRVLRVGYLLEIPSEGGEFPPAS